MGYSRLFRSRWAALIWSAGIIWGAVSFVGVDTSDEVSTNQVGVLNQIQALVSQLKS